MKLVGPISGGPIPFDDDEVLSVIGHKTTVAKSRTTVAEVHLLS